VAPTHLIAIANSCLGEDLQIQASMGLEIDDNKVFLSIREYARLALSI